MLDLREPDYSQYSLPDLLDVEQWIDRERFPERYARLRDEIASRNPVDEEDDAEEAAFRVFDGRALPPRLRQTHTLLVAFLIGLPASLSVMVVTFSLLRSGTQQTLETLEISPVLLAGVVSIYVLLIYASIDFCRGKRWARFVLWPAALSMAVQLSMQSLIGLYVIWVLIRTRAPSSTPSAPAA